MFQTSILFFTLNVVFKTQVAWGIFRDNMAFVLPYTPSLTNVCRDQQLEYYKKNARMCCSKCPPGHHVLEECHNTTDTVCQPCGAGAYTELWNFMRQCHNCDAPCREDLGLIETQACNASHDRICSCSPNKYCAAGLTHGCLICADLTICPKGSEVSKAGTQNSDTECSPCPPGTFSDEESYSTLCKPHRNCRSVSVAGNNTHDTICTAPEVDIFANHITPLVIEISADEIPGPASTSEYPQTLTGAGNVSSVKVVDRNIAVPLGVICGGTLFAMVGLAGIAFVFTSGKTRCCCSNLNTEAMEPNTAAEKQLDKRQHDFFMLSSKSEEQEQEYLLETLGSSSCSLELPPASAVIEGISKDRNEAERQKWCLTHEGEMASQQGLQMNSVSSGKKQCCQVLIEIEAALSMK